MGWRGNTKAYEDNENKRVWTSESPRRLFPRGLGFGVGYSAKRSDRSMLTLAMASAWRATSSAAR